MGAVNPREHGKPGEVWRVTVQNQRSLSSVAEWLLLDGELREQARELGYVDGQPVALVGAGGAAIEPRELYAVTTLDDEVFDVQPALWEVVYPEHEKLAKVKDESQAIGEFLENCGYTLCEIMYDAPWNGPGGLTREPTRDGGGAFYAVSKGTNRILADYYGIDLDRLEAEKRQMLDKLREASAR